jgi:hypothetical protein
MESKDQFTLQVLLRDTPISQATSSNVAITCTSAWGINPVRKSANITEDNLYAGTSEGEILHFFLDRNGATDNVTSLMSSSDV